MAVDPSTPSPHTDHTAPVRWREWGEEPFAEAGADRLVFLYLTASWSRQCHHMDAVVFAAPGVAAMLNEQFVPVRVDADRLPHVQDRYIAGGWPTNAILTPTGEVLWSAVHVDAAELLGVGRDVRAMWAERRNELNTEIERRRRALEATHARHAPVGLVRRESADDVVTAIREAFDSRNGGFGDAPKFPEPEAIELLQLLARRGDADAARMADHTLDGMLAGELMDRAEGGFYRYALEADWTQPRQEKLLAVNAGLLEVYARGATERGRHDWREVAERTVAWADNTLRRTDGMWCASQADDAAYHATDANARAAAPRPCIDPTLYTSANARWIAALARAGQGLGREDWVAAGAQALDLMLTVMATADGPLAHYRVGDERPQIDFLLIDTLAAADAALALHSANAPGEWLDRARTLAATLERCFWADDGGFWERRRSPHDVGALRYRERPFEPNAHAARLLLRLARVQGERGMRGRAERILAVLSPGAGRYGVAGATFAIAVEEYFDGARRD